MLLESLYGKGKRLIDIGCGKGMFTRAVAKEFGSVVSIDVNEGRLAALSEHCREAGLDNVEVRAMDAHALEFGEGAFDAALFYRSVDHIPAYRGALEEAYRVVARGGAVSVFVADTRRSSAAIEILLALRGFEDSLFDAAGVGDGMCEVRPVDVEALKGELGDIGFVGIREEVDLGESAMAEEYRGRIEAKSLELLAMLETSSDGGRPDRRREFEGLRRRADEAGVALRPTVELFATRG